jgi:hypothetical protein
MVEDEIERPADMGMGVAQARQNGGTVQVHDPGIDVLDLPAYRDRRYPVAFDEKVSGRGLLGGVARAGEKFPVRQQDSIAHLTSFRPL